MDENEKLARVLLGALFSVSNGIQLGFSAQESQDMIALICDMVSRKMEIDITSPSQVIRLKEECGNFVVDEIIKETV